MYIVLRIVTTRFVIINEHDDDDDDDDDGGDDGGKRYLVEVMDVSRRQQLLSAIASSIVSVESRLTLRVTRAARNERTRICRRLKLSYFSVMTAIARRVSSP